MDKAIIAIDGFASTGKSTLGKMLSKLQKMSEEFNVAVLMTNQVMADPSGMAMVAVPKPVGGHVLAHCSTTRLNILSKSKC